MGERYEQGRMEMHYNGHETPEAMTALVTALTVGGLVVERLPDRLVITGPHATIASLANLLDSFGWKPGGIDQ